MVESQPLIAEAESWRNGLVSGLFEQKGFACPSVRTPVKGKICPVTKVQHKGEIPNPQFFYVT